MLGGTASSADLGGSSKYCLLYTSDAADDPLWSRGLGDVYKRQSENLED